MDIIFQFGEFYGESDGLLIKLLGSVIGALISGLFAILVFVIGTRIEKNKIIKTENKRLAELTDYFKTAIELVLEKTIVQSNYLIDFSHELKTRDFKDRTMQSSVALKIDGIRSISNTDLYKIFSAKNPENAKQFNEFQTYLELINSYKNYIPKLLNDFNESFHKTQKEFGEEVTKFISLYDKIAKNNDNEVNPEMKTIIEFWASKIKSWKDIDENLIDNYRTDPYIVYDNIIKPLIDFIRSNHFESISMEFLNSANNCEFHLKNFDHSRYMNRIICLNAARRLINTRNGINEIIKNCL